VIDFVLQNINKEYSRMQVANAVNRASYENNSFQSLDELCLIQNDQPSQMKENNSDSTLSLVG